MAYSSYPVLEIQPEWVLEPEVLGSKTKFWYRIGNDRNQPLRLFKFPQLNTGQHWSEKIAAEIANALGILHAKVDLAIFERAKGSATESFARGGRTLFHGNQILAGQVVGYDPAKRFGQSDHTLVNILIGIERLFENKHAARMAQIRFAGFLVLDALIGNTDRHHENWGVLIREVSGERQGMIAPTFDHASSLGRELLDRGQSKCRERLLNEGRIGNYSEKAPGAIFWDKSDAKGLGPLELVRRASQEYPDLFKPALARLARLDRTAVEKAVGRVPSDWMTELARNFAFELMCYNNEELRKIPL